MEKFKIISWNVNGFRAWWEKEDSKKFLKKEKPDIFCLQEVKAKKEQIEEKFEKKISDIFKEYPFWEFNSAEKLGYSGVVIFSKKKPKKIFSGIGDDLDSEGRVLTFEFENFFLTTVYTPNSKPDLSRQKYRSEKWDKNFLKFVKKLEKKKPVIFCGDLNAAHTEIDLKNPQANKTTKNSSGNAGFTDSERKSFEDYLKSGFIDTFRYFYPEKKEIYTWWSYRFGARKNNAGWRIDYFLTSKVLEKKLENAFIYNKTLGSDHCPVGLLVKV